jgi:hypothetical protein
MQNNTGWKLAGILATSFITVVTSLSLFITSGLKSEIGGVKIDLIQTENRITSIIKDIDIKLFSHLTNHDLHIPRNQVITRNEFDTYTKNQEQVMNRICNLLESIRGSQTNLLLEKKEKK